MGGVYHKTIWNTKQRAFKIRGMEGMNDIGVSLFIILLIGDVLLTYRIYRNKENGDENKKD